MKDFGWKDPSLPHPAEAIVVDRGYGCFFRVLAGDTVNVVNSSVRLLQPPKMSRGLPTDSCDSIKEYFRAYEVLEDYGLPYVVMANELVDFAWDEQCILNEGFVTERSAEILGVGPLIESDLIRNQIETKCKLDRYKDPNDPHEVATEWTLSPRDWKWAGGEFLDRFLREVRELGPPDETRIFYWFEP